MSIFKIQLIRRALPFALVVAFAGCERAKPRVYLQPKELPPPEEKHSPDDGHDHGAPVPKLGYSLPAGWKDAGADQMNIARFSIEAGGGAASVNVTPLALLEGRDTFLVNMWREQLGQPQLGDEDAAKALREVDIAGAKGRQFEVTGQREGKGMRIVTAFLHRGDRSWFFKLQGDVPAVEASLAAFGEFLKSVKFEAPAAPAPAPPVEAPSAPALPVEAPSAPAPPAPAPAAGVAAGWTVAAPGPMQAAKFSVPEKDGAKAEVTVSIFPNDTGGTVSNVKRWRGQIGMPEADDAAILASAKPIEGIEGAVMVELENAGRALTGAIVPRGGQFYFYKLMGGTPAVAAAREAFVGFVKTK